MSCFNKRGGVVPTGFGFVGGSNACQGSTPYCPLGSSKYQCGAACCNPNSDNAPRNKTCNFYEAPAMFAEQVAHEAPQPDPAAAGWTEIGKAISTDFAPQIAYLTKSCTRCDVEPFRSSAECNGCRSDAGLAYKNVPPGNLPPRDDDGTEVPGRYRTGGSPWLQRPQSAYERKTMCTNYGIGYGYSQPQCFCEPATQNGMRYGVLHAGGCKDNRCNQDPFYHPAVKAVTAPIREFRLYARASDCGTSRFQYAVAPCNTHSPLLVTLPSDPRQPPWSSCSSVGFARQAYLQLVGGDRIYIPGMPGSFFVHLFVDDVVGPYRPDKQVFRGYSPVRSLRGKSFTANSGLRNFTALPSANGLLRPF